MRTLYFRKRIILFFVALILLGATCVVSADTVNQYKLGVNIRQDNVVEYSYSINIVFEQPVDYFEFKLPSELKGKVSNVKVESFEYSYDQDTNTIVILDPGQQISGRKNFAISYQSTGVNNYGKSADTLDLYLLPSGTNAVIGKLAVSIKYHEGFEWVNFKTNYENWQFDKGARRILIAESDYYNTQGINIHFELPIAYWANATELGISRNFALIVLLAGIVIFVLLRIIFKNDDNIEIIECRYPSSEITPAQAGYAIDGVVDDRDFVASLLYAAHEGYIRIVEYELRKFKFVYLKAPEGNKRSVEILIKMLFHDGKVGDEVYLDKIQDSIKKNMRKFKRAVYHDFNGRFRFLTSASKTAGIISMFTFFVVVAVLPLMNYISRGVNIKNVTDGIVSAILFAVGLTLLLIVVCNSYRKMKSRRGDGNSRRFNIFCILYAIAGAIYVFMYRFAYRGRHADTMTAIVAAVFLIIAPLMLMGMRTLSKHTRRLVGEIMGLKQYIETADKQEAKETSKGDPDYFFTLLPYALLFGKSHKLASFFEFTDVDSPNWYIPYGLSEGYKYDVVVFNSMTNNLQTQLNETVFNLTK